MNADHCAIDELAAFDPLKINETIHQVLLSTRLKNVPNKIMIATTPKNIPYIRNLIRKRVPTEKEVIMTTGTTYDNAVNLGDSFMHNIKSIEGTSFARQELYGELIDTDSTQQFEETDFKLWPYNKRLPKLHRVVIGLDTATSEKESNCPTGCTVAGVFWDNDLKDWSILILDCWEKWLGWDKLVAETIKMWETPYGEEGERSRLPDVIAVENKSTGIPLYQHLCNYKNRDTGKKINIVKREANIDKYVRILLAQPIVKSGRVYVMSGYNTRVAQWVEPLIKQLVELESSERNDISDSFAHLMLYLQDINWVQMDFPDREPPKPTYGDEDDELQQADPNWCPYG